MADGQVTLNDFQNRLEQRLNATLRSLERSVDSRRVGWEEIPFPTSTRQREAIVHVKVQELDVRIREDTVSFSLFGRGDYYEMLDYSDADALADAFLAELTKRWRDHWREQHPPGGLDRG